MLLLSFAFHILLSFVSANEVKLDIQADKIGQGCSLKEQQVVSPLPAIRQQGALGLCSSFALATVYDHMFCKQQPEKCKSNEPIFNVLDIARKSTSDFFHGTYTMNMAQKLKGQKIYSESCRPYKTFRAKSANGFTSYNTETGKSGPLSPNEFDYPLVYQLQQERKKLNDRKLTQIKPCDIEKIKTHFEELLSTSLTISQVTNALTAQSEQNFMNALIFPQVCESQIIDVPAGILKSLEIPDQHTLLGYLRDAKEGFELTTGASLRSILKSNRPIIWNYKSNSLFNYKSDNGHASVIIGYRNVCCNNECRTEYRIRDSAGVENKNEFWISQEDLRTRTSKIEDVSYCKSATDKETRRCSAAFTYFE